MKRWLRARLEWMDSQFTAPPVATPSGGTLNPGQSVTLNGPNRIAYSLDGSDPKHCRHTIARNQSLPIPHTATLRARNINADGSLGALGTFHYEIPGSDPSTSRTTAPSRWLWLLAIGPLILLWRVLRKRRAAF